MFFLKKATSYGAAVFVLAAVFAILGCGGRDAESRTGSEDTLEFIVDQTLLDSAVQIPELSVEFQPPTGWSAFDDPPEQELPLEVFRLFVGSGPSYLLAGSLPDEDNPEAVAADLATMEGDEKTSFTHNGIGFHQVRRITDQSVTFSLVFVPPTASETVRVGLLQYVLPLSELEYRARLVESSIGSIIPLEQ